MTTVATPTLSRVDRRVNVAQAALGFCIGALGAVLVLLARDLGVAASRLTWLSSAFGIGLLVLGACGRWLLAWGALRTLRLGAMLLAVGALVLGLAAEPEPAMFAGGLVGGGGALVVLATPALITGASASTRLARATAIASSAGVVGPLLVGGLDRLTGRGRAGLLVAVVLSASALLPVACGHRRVGAGGEPGRASDPTALADALPRAVAVWPWLRLVAAVAVEFCFVVWAVSRLRVAAFDPAAAATAGAAFPVGMVTSRVLVARRRSARGVLPVAVFAATMGTMVVASEAPGVVVVLALFLAGLGVAPLYPVLLAQLVDAVAPAVHRGATLGALGSGVAIFVGPQAFAMLAAEWGQRMAFLFVLPLLLPIVVRRPPHPFRRPA